MRNHTLRFSFLFILLLQIYFPSNLFSAQNAPTAVTYEFSGGRLGDNLITYLHAKWISYKYEIPLLYKPFDYSDEFLFDETESKYSIKHTRKYQRTVLLGREQTVSNNQLKSTLYIVPYFPESACERVYFKDRHGAYFPYFQVDWKDKKFRALAFEMLKPKKAIRLCECPKDKTTIAIHVRTGGGFDAQNLSFIQPIKCPPETFYLEQLTTICELLPDEELYFHIFTDDRNPAQIANRFQSYLGEERAHFAYRQEGNFHNQNVLEDLFSMMQFDCLIRPESSYSILASILKDYKILIHPDDFAFIKKHPVITKSKIIKN